MNKPNPRNLDIFLSLMYTEKENSTANKLAILYCFDRSFC